MRVLIRAFAIAATLSFASAHAAPATTQQSRAAQAVESVDFTLYWY